MASLVSDTTIEPTLEELQVSLIKINHFIDSLMPYEEWVLLKPRDNLDCRHFEWIHKSSRQMKQLIEESIKLKSLQ